MKIPYDVINKALAAELAGVRLMPDLESASLDVLIDGEWQTWTPGPNDEDLPYMLHFESDPTEAEMARATEIVNKIMPSQWHHDEIRRQHEEER